MVAFCLALLDMLMLNCCEPNCDRVIGHRGRIWTIEKSLILQAFYCVALGSY
jgi:hypothetical protein